MSRQQGQPLETRIRQEMRVAGFIPRYTRLARPCLHFKNLIMSHQQYNLLSPMSEAVARKHCSQSSGSSCTKALLTEQWHTSLV